ncbi:MAG: DUF3352 domain-containing protein [Solirubrobacterales bacterium]
MRAAHRLASIATALAAAVALAACGGDDGDDAGPAALVPADVPAYVELAVQPEGEARDNAEAALEKVTGSDDPGADIAALFEDAAGGGPGDFTEDIEPWLGERLGIYPSSLAGDTETVLVVETTDGDEALDAFEDEGESEQEYEGHTLLINSDGDAVSLVDDFIVFGRPAGVRQVVDVAEGDDALAGSDQFTDAIDELPEDRLATLFALPRSFFEAIPRREIDPQGRELLLQAMGDAADEPVLGDVTASGEQLTLELSAGGGGVETGQSELLGQVPGDSWLAIALADIGAAIENGLDQTAEARIPGLSAEALRREVQAETGIDLERAAASLGDGAVFVQGTSDESLGGAVVIETTDAAASAELLANLQELIGSSGVEVEPLASTEGDQGFQIALPGADDAGGAAEIPGASPDAVVTQPITVVQRDDRIVAAYGGEALNQALSADGGEPLQGTAVFRRAREAAGELGIDAFVSVAPLVQLAESTGLAEDASYARLKPYLDALDFLALAVGGDGDRGILRFTLGLGE